MRLAARDGVGGQWISVKGALLQKRGRDLRDGQRSNAMGASSQGGTALRCTMTMENMTEAKNMGRTNARGTAIMSEVLTLRLTPEEMLRFKLAALSLRKKRAVLVRERVADLIRLPPVPATAAGHESTAPEADGTVADGTGIGGDQMSGTDANPMRPAGAAERQVTANG